jgi:hypothetical protein
MRCAEYETGKLTNKSSELPENCFSFISLHILYGDKDLKVVILGDRIKVVGKGETCNTKFRPEN